MHFIHNKLLVSDFHKIALKKKQYGAIRKIDSVSLVEPKKNTKITVD